MDEKRNNGDGYKQLVDACYRGDLKSVIALCNRPGTNINLASKFRAGPPLHVACARGHLNVVKYLVEAGADINLTEPMDYNTPLIYTIYCGIRTPYPKLTTVIDYLAARPGINLAAKNARGDTFLSAAMNRVTCSLFAHICKNVFSYEIPYNIVINALNAAIRDKRMDIIDYLVKNIHIHINEETTI